jgi:hypothetical protein
MVSLLTCKPKSQAGEDGMLKYAGLALLFGTTVGVAWAQGSGKFDGQYVGDLTLTKEISGDCTRPPVGAVYPLTISGGKVRFVYRPRFGTTLTGSIDGNGNFTASTRVSKGIVLMSGKVQGNTVSASITSPSCNYSFKAKKEA